ncbi:MAG: MarR family winged helix-turn-helix transcriptional regulator [Candidatus Limnocylindrales bacterium]|jgi:DNA-binding MarR family transcriptional regulator
MSEVSGAQPGAQPAAQASGQPAGPISAQPAEKLLEIEAVLESLGAVRDLGAHEIPGWVGQDLTFGQMRLLFLLSQNGPSPMSHVAEWLGVGLPAASGIVERVERHGLVTRHHRSDDRRVVECLLTDQGRGLIEEISGLRREVLRQTLGVLSDDELAQLARLISIILARTTMRLEQP